VESSLWRKDDNEEENYEEDVKDEDKEGDMLLQYHNIPPRCEESMATNTTRKILSFIA
jgi:hypothetical protein